MIKYDLREHGCTIKEKTTKNFIVTILWMVSIFFMVATAVVVPIYINNVINRLDMTNRAIVIEMDSAMVPVYFLQFILFVSLYFALKFVFTWLFCSDRYNSIRLKFLEDYSLPVCYCREAFTVWQTVVIYMLPVIVVYSFMFFIGATIGGDPFRVIDSGYMTMLFFMSVFMAFDVSLVVCVLYNKIIHRVDYVAVDYHIFKMTFYKEIYLIINGKKEKSRIKATASQVKEQMFIKMTTCLNPECENYVKEIENGSKKCLSCGGKIYLAEVLPNMVTCTDKECENYGQELKPEAEICTSCGRRTQPLAFIFNPRLALPTVVTSLSTVIIFAFIDLYLVNYGIAFDGPSAIDIPGVIKGLIFLICIVMGILSKKKLSIIVPIICIQLSSLITDYIRYIM